MGESSGPQCGSKHGETNLCWWATRGHEANDVLDRIRWHLSCGYQNEIWTHLLLDAMNEIQYLRGYKKAREEDGAERQEREGTTQAENGRDSVDQGRSDGV